jgi:nitrosocyanin
VATSLLKLRKLLVVISIALIIGTVLSNVVLAQPAESYVKKFTVKAFRFGFDPEVLVVNQGDIVVITVEAQDAVHGFYIEDYEVRQDYIVPGSPQTVSFVADRVGMFRIHCSTICGALHPFMMAQLIVQPNFRFIGSALGVSTLTIAFFAYVWIKKESE